MWTRFKIAKQGSPKLNGNRFVESFVPCNTCATNKHVKKKYLVYLVNIYENPIIINWFGCQGVKVNEDASALS